MPASSSLPDRVDTCLGLSQPLGLVTIGFARQSDPNLSNYTELGVIRSWYNESMVLVFGERLAGRIDGVGEQYGCTRFFHILFLPVVPTAGLWVVSEEREEAHETRYSVRSVVSGYLRTWMPVLAIGQFYFGALPGLVTYVLLTISIATYFWWNLRGAKNLHIASMFAQTLGTACPPSLFRREDAKLRLQEVELCWSEAALGRTVQDVARFGASTDDEAAMAFTILVLRVRTKTGDAAQNRQLVAAILNGLREPSVSDLAGPMRRRGRP